MDIVEASSIMCSRQTLAETQTHGSSSNGSDTQTAQNPKFQEALLNWHGTMYSKSGNVESWKDPSRCQ
jgi:hypothetical protein